MASIVGVEQPENWSFGLEFRCGCGSQGGIILQRCGINRKGELVLRGVCGACHRPLRRKRLLAEIIACELEIRRRNDPLHYPLLDSG